MIFLILGIVLFVLTLILFIPMFKAFKSEETDEERHEGE